MSFKRLNIKDNYIRIKYKKLEIYFYLLRFFINIYKNIKQNLFEKNVLRENIYKLFFNLKSQFSKTKLKVRCSLSFNGRSPYKMFKISRHILKQNIQKGLYFGIKKSSW
jgi:ribosomal protein S14